MWVIKMSKPELTFSQQVIYDCIVKYIAETDSLPSMRTIMRMAGLNTVSTVYVHLQHLKEKGYITYTPGKNKSIRPVEMLERID